MRILALLLLAPAIVRADDVVLTDGTIFHNATIVSHTSTTASISFADGAAMVRLDRLDAASLLKVAKQPVLNSSVSSDTKTAPETGPITSDPAVANNVSDAAKPPPPKIDQRIVPLVDAAVVNALGRTLEIKPDGCVISLAVLSTQQTIVPHSENVSVNVVPEGLGHTPVMQTETKRWTTTETQTVRNEIGTVFLSCQMGDTVQGGIWKGRVWRIGRYVTPSGATLPKYTAIPEEAYAFFSIHPDEIPAASNSDPHLFDTPVQSSTSVSTAPMQ